MTLHTYHSSLLSLTEELPLMVASPLCYHIDESDVVEADSRLFVRRPSESNWKLIEASCGYLAPEGFYHGRRSSSRQSFGLFYIAKFLSWRLFLLRLFKIENYCLNVIIRVSSYSVKIIMAHTVEEINKHKSTAC